MCGVSAHAYNPGAREAKAGECEFKACRGYLATHQSSLALAVKHFIVLLYNI